LVLVEAKRIRRGPPFKESGFHRRPKRINTIKSLIERKIMLAKEIRQIEVTRKETKTRRKSSLPRASGRELFLSKYNKLLCDRFSQ